MNSVAAISSSEVGLAGELFDNCLELYSALFKTLHHSQTLSKLQDRSLRKQLERFLLWGDGFNPAKGELDSILTTPDGSSLNSLILQLLRAIGKQLVRRRSLLSYTYVPKALICNINQGFHFICRMRCSTLIFRKCSRSS